MTTLDDLLSQRRRAPLSEADERRVQIGVKSSLDHRLALLAGEAFDRAGAPQPGDPELVRKIVRQVTGEWSGTFQRQPPASIGARSRPRWSRWAAVPTLIAGVAAASWGGERLLHALRDAAPEPPPPPSATVAQTQARVEPLVLEPRAVEPEGLQPPLPAAEAPVPSRAAVETATEAAPERSAAAPRAARAVNGLAPPRALQPVRSGPRASAPAPVLLRPAAPPAGSGAAALGPDDTARSLFLRASKLRQDDWTAAAALYELLIQRFAGSTEAGVAEMALGKHALNEGHAGEALSWFRAYQQRPSGELTSEALWGEARSLESLGEAAAARSVWRRLITEYPTSAYAAVARQQLGS